MNNDTPDTTPAPQTDAVERDAKPYFIYDPWRGFTYYATEKERDDAAEGIIESYLNDTWNEEVENIVGGIVTHAIQQTKRVDKPTRSEGESEDDYSDRIYELGFTEDNIEYTCSYALVRDDDELTTAERDTDRDDAIMLRRIAQYLRETATLGNSADIPAADVIMQVHQMHCARIDELLASEVALRGERDAVADILHDSFRFMERAIAEGVTDGRCYPERTSNLVWDYSDARKSVLGMHSRLTAILAPTPDTHDTDHDARDTAQEGR